MLNIVKYHLSNNELKEIENYGIFEYFNNDNNNIKMLAMLYNNLYVIDTEKDYRSQHYGMHMNIEQRFGSSSCFIASIGDDLNVFAMN